MPGGAFDHWEAVLVVWILWWILMVIALATADFPFGDAEALPVLGVGSAGGLIVAWLAVGAWVENPLAVTLMGAVVVVAIAALILGLRHLRREGSRSMRAASALAAGNTQQAIELYAQAGDHEAIKKTLAQSLPTGSGWGISDVLVRAVDQVLALQVDIADAEKRGVKNATTAAIAKQAKQIGQALWVTADRISLVGSKDLPRQAIQEDLEREERNLEQVAERVEGLRVGLQKALLGGTASVFLERVVRSTLRELDSMLRADRGSSY